MASIPSTRFPSTPTTTTSYRKPNLFHLRPFPLSSPKFPPSTSCRCQSSSSSGTDDTGSKRRRWDAIFQDAVKAAVKRWEDYVGSLSSSRATEKEEDAEEPEVAGIGKIIAEDTVDWNWERWKKHFDDVEEQERIVSVLKAQLKDAVLIEDYRDAVRLQRAIAAAVTNDAVGSAIQLLNKAIEEERYCEAAQIRENAGTGLIGWWAGRSEDSADPQGRIIHITAEHGRYIARSYTSRQLASGRSGHPLFEIYFTVGNKGEYKQQAVYLKRKDMKLENSLKKPTEPVIVENLSSLSSLAEENDDLSIEEDGDIDENDKDSEISDGIAGIQNILQDLIPGVKVKVLKVVSPGKVDRDLISKVIEQIIEEEDDEDDSDDDDDNDDQDIEIETVELDDDSTLESDSQGIIVDSGDAKLDTADESSELSVQFVVSGIAQNAVVDAFSSDFVRMPAKLEKLSRFSFSFSVVTDDSLNGSDKKEHKAPNAISRSPNIRSADDIMADLTEVLTSKKRIPLKVLKDVGDLINLTVNQDQIPRPLSGKMFFNRIIIPATSDPLSGLYISSRGMFGSEVLYLRRKFGQWQEDGRKQDAIDLEFYEYVEALKLMGDPSVPAGQVAFRAKVGKRNQLPHKGIIPEEFGVVARYKGQGRLAEPGFRNPRWVDGELVILNGKYIRGGGPVIGFVYWAPEYHFLMFFNRLRLQN